jgi:large subunit ribosomal protein L31
MKAEIHPKYTAASVTTCVCGATFSYGSVNKETKIEICSNCHPFYTGLEKTLDTTGRVDRFKKKMAKATA